MGSGPETALMVRPLNMVSSVCRVLVIILAASSIRGQDIDYDGESVRKMTNPLSLAATDTEMLWQKDDGSYKMAYDAPSGFRAEVRDPNGGMKGVYGWTDEAGNLVTKTFLSDEKGFRYTDFSELGIKLPQLPFDLHPVAGQRKFPKDQNDDEEEDDDFEVKEPSVRLNQEPVQLHPFGRLIPEIEAVVIEPSVREHSGGNFKLGKNFNRPQAVGALAGQEGLGLYHRHSFLPQTSEVSRAVQLHNGLVYPYPLKFNHPLIYPQKVVYQNYVQHSPQYQMLTYSPWLMGK